MKFPVSRSIPNIPDNCNKEINNEVAEEEMEEEEINNEIAEEEMEEEEYDNENHETININQAIKREKRLSIPMIYLMNMNKVCF